MIKIKIESTGKLVKTNVRDKNLIQSEVALVLLELERVKKRLLDIEFDNLEIEEES